MRCERAQELFSDYCEGAVQEALSVPFEGHLQDCAVCRSQVEGLKSVWRTLGEAPVVAPPADFRLNVWQRIEAEEVRQQAAQQQPASGGLAARWQAWCRSLSQPTGRRRALAWSGAALLLILLAGVVIPGRYSAAHLGFPWSLFRSVPSPDAAVRVVSQVKHLEQGRCVYTISLKSEQAGVKISDLRIETQEENGRKMLVQPTFSAAKDAGEQVLTVEALMTQKVLVHVQWTTHGKVYTKDEAL